MIFFSKSIQKSLEIIAACSGSTQDFLSKLNQIQSSNKEKTSNSFEKLSDRVQNMIHVASSRGNVVPTTLNDEASQFFKLSNFSKAQQYLEHYLEANGIECTIPTVVANLWSQGCFVRFFIGSSSGWIITSSLSEWFIYWQNKLFIIIQRNIINQICR